VTALTCSLRWERPTLSYTFLKPSPRDIACGTLAEASSACQGGARAPSPRLLTLSLIGNLGERAKALRNAESSDRVTICAASIECFQRWYEKVSNVSIDNYLDHLGRSQHTIMNNLQKFIEDTLISRAVHKGAFMYRQPFQCTRALKMG
jgi:hypothetical protein